MRPPHLHALATALLLCACSSPADSKVAADADPKAPDGSDPGHPDSGPGMSCGSASSLSRVDFEHDGRSRGAQISLPADYDGTPRPLVLNFHGRDLSAAQQRSISLMDANANLEGYIVAYPEGVANTFNAGICCGEAQTQNVDDIGFSLALLDALESKLCIDSTAIYATGLSNGGYMSQRLACEAPERFAGFSSVAGLLAIASCTPSVRRPILLFHGTADPVVPYDGNAFLDSAKATMDAWAARNGCDASTSNVYLQGDASCVRYDACSAGNKVEFCTIAEGGHTWPGGTPVPPLGNTSTDVNANSYMWSFWNPASP